VVRRGRHLQQHSATGFLGTFRQVSWSKKCISYYEILYTINYVCLYEITINFMCWYNIITSLNHLFPAAAGATICVSTTLSLVLASMAFVTSALSHFLIVIVINSLGKNKINGKTEYRKSLFFSTSFRECLLKSNVDSHIANVGYIFFNLLRSKCFKFDLESTTNHRGRSLFLQSLKAKIIGLDAIPESLARHSLYKTQLEDYIRMVNFLHFIETKSTILFTSGHGAGWKLQV
jgi:hypothetical protein